MPRPRRLVAYVFLGVVTAISLGPSLWILSTSFRTPIDAAADPFGVPIPGTLGNYSEAWTTARFGDYALNSFVIALGTVVVVGTAGMLCAYGLTILRPRGSGALTATLLVGMTLPIWALINPLFRLVRDIGMLDSRIGVMLVESAIGLPLAVFLFRSFLKEFPTALLEAARIDGASSVRMLWSIVLPLSTPVLYTVLVFQFMFSWNELVIPLFLLQSDEARTLPVGLTFFQGRYSSNQSLISAGAVLASAPILIVYLIFQRRFVTGLTAGAVK